MFDGYKPLTQSGPPKYYKEVFICWLQAACMRGTKGDDLNVRLGNQWAQLQS